MSGSSTGSWSSGTGDLAAIRTVHDRDRAAPVALPRQQPVAQAVADRGVPETALVEPGDDALFRLGARQAAERTGVDEHLVLGMGRECAAVLGLVPTGGTHDGPDLDAVPLRKGVVALVVCGHGHDRARPVAHQDVVGDPDRDRLAVDRD